MRDRPHFATILNPDGKRFYLKEDGTHSSFAWDAGHYPDTRQAAMLAQRYIGWEPSYSEITHRYASEPGFEGKRRDFKGWTWETVQVPDHHRLIELELVPGDPREGSAYWKVHCRDNGVHVGDFIGDVDGYWKYWPEHDRGGSFEAYWLTALGALLDEMNADWQSRVTRDLARLNPGLGKDTDPFA